MRSILDLNIEELGQVLATNTLPEDVGLHGIETRDDFARLFKHRASPKYIAQSLLREKAHVTKGGYAHVEPPEVKAQRQANRQVELELRQKKVESTTQIQNHIYKKLQALEDSQMLIISALTSLRQQITQLHEG